MIIFCSAMVILSFICVICTKERITDEDLQSEAAAAAQESGNKSAAGSETNPIQAFKALITNRYWVTMFFAMFVIFFIMFATPFFMQKFGKSKIYILGLAVMTVGFAGFGLFANSLPMVIFFNALKGLGPGMAMAWSQIRSFTASCAAVGRCFRCVGVWGACRAV